MQVLVVFESMYGNTHAIATAIGEAMRTHAETRVVQVSEATPDLVAGADLLIVGGPTHARGMPTQASRASAVESAATSDGWSKVTLDPAAGSSGVREWLDALGDGGGKPAAAFDTRAVGPALITGRASTGIAKGLRDHGYRLIADPESFIVDTHQQLKVGEDTRAATWAASLAASLVPAG